VNAEGIVSLLLENDEIDINDLAREAGFRPLEQWLMDEDFPTHYFLPVYKDEQRKWVWGVAYDEERNIVFQADIPEYQLSDGSYRECSVPLIDVNRRAMVDKIKKLILAGE
jgi:hypothetical protein